MTKYTYDSYTMTYWFQTKDGEWDEVLEIPENEKKCWLALKNCQTDTRKLKLTLKLITDYDR